MKIVCQLSAALCWVLIAHAATWTYDDQEAWGDDYTDCNGNRQSPIDIVTANTRADPNLDSGFTFSKAFGNNIAQLKYRNNGHTLQMDEEDFENSDVTLKGGDLPMEDSDYTFLQFHSHWGSATEPGSEHTVDGKRFDAEIHFVFMSKSAVAVSSPDSLAVLGFFIEIAEDPNFVHGGQWDKLFSAITSNNLINKGGNTTDFSGTLAISDLIPVYFRNLVKNFYHYNGSLTTPPCFEVVNWYVFEQPIQVSQAQYNKFLEARFSYGEDKVMEKNYRDVQPINGRQVYRTSLASVNSKQPDWTYDNQASWGDKYPACNGQSQSPIDIDTDKTVHDAALDTGFTFASAMGIAIPFLRLMNKGYTWQMTDQDMQLHLLSDNMITSGPSLKGGWNDYSFWQFHYHWGTRDQPGSEHTINGVQYPAEVHFVFRSKSAALTDAGSLTVLGFMIDVYDGEGFQHGGEFGNILEAITKLKYKDNLEEYANSISISDLIPLYNPEFMSKFYHYDGSLTTPPCIEVVNWFVFQDPIYISQAQYDNFLEGYDFEGNTMKNTYRVVQPLNERTVYRSLKASNSILAHLSTYTVIIAAFIALFKY
ncbi:uncharacterized protein LOC142344644 [Convolutriloba macropyga]|uniref:uncharacterized protein LOC142344644 n=1 Tax=Convolutriloba macropyga TaxID=536237 RepID=UPI003F521BA6